MPVRSYSIVALAAIAQAGAALLDVSHVRCNPSLETLETPTFGNGSFWFPAAFTVCAEAVINGTVDGYAQDVAFLTGTNRNERAIDMDIPTEPISVPDFFNKTFGPRKGADIPAFLASGAFATPDPTDLAGVFNVTEEIYTNGEFTCIEGYLGHCATSGNSTTTILLLAHAVREIAVAEK